MSNQENNQSFHEQGSDFLGYTPPQEETGGRGNRGNRGGRGTESRRNYEDAEENSWEANGDKNQDQQKDENKEDQKAEQVPEKEAEEVNDSQQDIDNSWLENEPEEPAGRRRGRGQNDQDEKKQAPKEEEKKQEVEPQENQANNSWVNDQSATGNNVGQEIPADQNQNQSGAWGSSAVVEKEETNEGGRGNRGGRRGNRDSQNNEERENDRGGQRGGGRNTRGNRDSNRDSNREYPNRQYNNYNNDQNREGGYGGYNRGNREHGGFRKKEGFQNGRGGDNQRRNNYQRNDYNNNNYNSGGRGGGYRGRNGNRDEDQDKTGQRDFKRGYGNNNNYHNGKPNNFDQQSNHSEQSNDPKVENKNTEKKQVLLIEPKGQKCWPESSIFIKGIKVCFSYRKIVQHSTDILIIPYRDLKFNVYPGKIINLFEVDYRKKLESKGEQINAVGSLCCQKCMGVDNFKALGFLRIGEEGSKIDFHNLFKNLSRVKSKFKTILLPYSEDLGQPKQLFEEIFKILGQLSQKIFEKIIITTEKDADFIKGVQVFTNQIIQMTQNNEIYIDH